MEALRILQARANLLKLIIDQGRSLVTFAEASHITGLKQSSLRVYATQGRISVQKNGRRAFLNIEDLAAIIL